MGDSGEYVLQVPEEERNQGLSPSSSSMGWGRFGRMTMQRAMGSVVMGVCGLAGAYVALYLMAHWMPIDINLGVTLSVPPHM